LKERSRIPSADFLTDRGDDEHRRVSSLQRRNKEGRAGNPEHSRIRTSGSPDAIAIVEGSGIKAMDAVIDRIAEAPGIVGTESKVARWID